MMLMNRLYLITIFALCYLSILLTACGGGSGETSGDENTATNTTLSSSLILDSQHGGYAGAWGLENCDACHQLQAIHSQATNIQNIVRLHGYATCTGCHGNNGTTASRQCIICHNTTDLPTQPQQQGVHRHSFISTTAVAANDKDCLTCHYNTDMNGVFDINRDLVRFRDANQIYSPYSSITDFCQRCHNRDHQQPGFELQNRDYNDPIIAIEDNWKYTDKHGEIDGMGARIYTGLRNGYRYQSRVECTDCHAMHGTSNQSLIIDKTSTGATLLDENFRNRPYAVNINNTDYSQLCVVCHNMSSISDQGDQDTGNGLSGVHQIGTDCKTCHSHGEAVQAGM